ncbi:MAG: DUF3489 domain-containing protein [Magnetospirillum sp. WYHS-4]
MTKLSDTQLVILSAAAGRPKGRVLPLTVALKGAAVGKVVDSLIAKGLIEETPATAKDARWRDAEDGAVTLRITRAGIKIINAEAADEDAAAETTTPRTREGSKQAKLIEMLKRPQGASIAEIAETFKWAGHTVRGVVAEALKKKLGLAVTSEKIEGRGRVYAIRTEG